MNITQTQMKILEVGKREFLKYGFKDASLQKIVSLPRVHFTDIIRIRLHFLKHLCQIQQIT